MARLTQRQKLEIVAGLIASAGYDPKAQLTGYLQTGNAAYITRQGGARTMIREVGVSVIKKYLKERDCLQAA